MGRPINHQDPQSSGSVENPTKPKTDEFLPVSQPTYKPNKTGFLSITFNRPTSTQAHVADHRRPSKGPNGVDNKEGTKIKKLSFQTKKLIPHLEV